MIWFDIDGVVADVYSEFRAGILKRFGYDIDSTPDRTFQIEVPGHSKNEVWEVVDDVLTDQDRVKPYPEAAAAIRKFIELKGCPVYFLSARKECFREETLRWLILNLHLSPWELRLILSNGSKAKYDLIPSYVTHFVEDRLRTANELAARGKRIFLINRPWNIGRDTHSDVTRVDNLFDVHEIMAHLNIRRG